MGDYNLDYLNKKEKERKRHNYGTLWNEHHK